MANRNRLDTKLQGLIEDASWEGLDDETALRWFNDAIDALTKERDEIAKRVHRARLQGNDAA